METLKQMFGEKFSESTIQSALSLNKGSLERTIDYLLTTTEKKEQVLTTKKEQAYVPSFRRGQRQRLDPQFLTGFLDRIESDQESEDRVLAQMLQNQMYMSQLPPEFRQYMQQQQRQQVASKSDETTTTRPRRNFWANLSTTARKKWEQLSSQFKQK